LPRQRATQEVDQHVAKRLQIVSTRLLHAEVCVDRCVASGMCVPVRGSRYRFARP
jgi:hypothetical protein